MAALGLSRASRHSVRVPGGEGLGELQLDVLCAPAPSASSSPAILFYVLDPEPLLFGAASLFTYSSAGYFAALPTSAEQQFQRLHVVGVGHAASDVSANANGWDNAALRQLRRRDFPPFEHESIRAGRAANACAGRFASAVVDHVIPHVEGTLLGLHERPRRAILGASYSAVMALQIMLRHPQAFDDFVLGSPSVCFDPEILTLLQKISLKRDPASIGVFIAIGALEREPIPEAGSGRLTRSGNVHPSLPEGATDLAQVLKSQELEVRRAWDKLGLPAPCSHDCAAIPTYLDVGERCPRI